VTSEDADAAADELDDDFLTELQDGDESDELDAF
jgi:hypothetical protein